MTRPLLPALVFATSILLGGYLLQLGGAWRFICIFAVGPLILALLYGLENR